MAGTFGFGTTFSITVATILTPIAELTNIKGVDMSADDVDMTSHDSADGFREFSQGLKDGGTVELEGNFISDTSQEAMISLFQAGTSNSMKITFAGSIGSWTFNGYVNKFSIESPMDDKISFSASVKISGKPVLA